MEKIIYRKSFQAKLIESQETIPFYQDIKDVCATHKGVRTRLSFNKEVISYQRQKIAMMKINRKNIGLYLALNYEKFKDFNTNIKDNSDKKIGEEYPMMILIKNKKALSAALSLLEKAMNNVGATKLCSAEVVDYFDVFYPRSFDVLLSSGLIKKYVRHIVDGKSVLEEVETDLCSVHFTAKLKYCAKNHAEDLYIITNYSNWNPKTAVLMSRVDDTTFTADMKFPKGITLEFKICRADNWDNVEKGIWKEEIINHHYLLVDKDLEIEDLIHNFRED